jgi:Na+/proline symporter
MIGTLPVMSHFDWAVLGAWLVFLTAYGLWRGRGSNTVDQYLVAGKTMPWYAMGLSIMATQASAITFVSTTGQGYSDGMRFVQYYFGLPVAMVVIAAFVAPRFHASGVYTAYEYLEKRFDLKTRALVGTVFLVGRGLSAGVALYAPAVVLSVVLRIPDWQTTLIMGTLVVIYTTSGGIKAVTWADTQQMLMITVGLLVAFGVALWNLPPGVGFAQALDLAGTAGRLNAVVTSFDWKDRYNIFSGLIGGSFLAMAYFGADQSQVQRYLTGKNIAQARLSLIFNAAAKIPLQFFILLIGVMVFAMFHFSEPPVIFEPVEMQRLNQAGSWELRQRYQEAHQARRLAALRYLNGQPEARAELDAARGQFEGVRKEALATVRQLSGKADFSDTNYIFLYYVTNYLPVGLVGLLVGVIFTAAMSAISGEINSLATVTVIDFYQRLIRPGAGEGETLLASRLATAFWGVFAMGFAQFAGGLGNLIEAVNIVGSLFYPGMLGAFVLAFGFKRVGGTAAFWGVILGELVVFYLARFAGVAFLWYNVAGCLAVVLSALVLQAVRGSRKTAGSQA